MFPQLDDDTYRRPPSGSRDVVLKRARVLTRRRWTIRGSVAIAAAGLVLLGFATVRSPGDGGGAHLELVAPNTNWLIDDRGEEFGLSSPLDEEHLIEHRITRGDGIYRRTMTFAAVGGVVDVTRFESTESRVNQLLGDPLGGSGGSGDRTYFTALNGQVNTVIWRVDQNLAVSIHVESAISTAEALELLDQMGYTAPSPRCVEGEAISVSLACADLEISEPEQDHGTVEIDE